jgi:hypothetical protein
MFIEPGYKFSCKQEQFAAEFSQPANVSFVRKGRELKVVSELKSLDVTRDGIEPPTRGFSVVYLSHSRNTQEHLSL